MVSKLLVSRATLPFHRITRSHTSSSSNFFSSSLSLLPRAQLFNARHHGEEAGKRKETLLENDKFQAISKQEGRGIVATPPLPFKQAKATISHSSSYLLCHRENLREPCRPPTNQPFHASTLDRSTLLISLSRSPPD